MNRTLSEDRLTRNKEDLHSRDFSSENQRMLEKTYIAVSSLKRLFSHMMVAFVIC
jgi:hypothetical protein